MASSHSVQVLQTPLSESWQDVHMDHTINMRPCVPCGKLQAQALSLAFLMAAKASASDAPSGTPGHGRAG